jgi:hypothetical protein
MAFLAGTAVYFEEPLFGMFIAWSLLWNALDMIKRSSTNRVLTTLPIEQRNLATSFWTVAVIAIPLTFVAGEATYTTIQDTVGTSFEVSTILIVKRGVFAVGFTSSYSMFLAFNRQYFGETIRASMGRKLTLSIPSISAIAISLAFLWQMASTANPTRALDAVAALTVLGVACTSFRCAKYAWFPRSKARMQEPRPLTRSGKRDHTPSLSSRGAACLHVFWLRFAKLGAGLWLAYSAALGLCTLYLEGTIFASLDPDLLVVFIGVSILPATILVPSLLPDVRCVRMLPLSRVQQALLQVSLPLSFSVASLALAPAVAQVFGFPQLMTLAVLIALGAIHLVISVFMLRWGYRAGTVLTVFAMLAIVLASSESNLNPWSLIAVAGLLTVASYAYTHFLVGASSKLYQRKSAMEEMLAKWQ